MNAAADHNKTSLGAELKIINKAAWPLALMVLLFWALVAVPHFAEVAKIQPGGLKMPDAVFYALLNLAGLVMAAYVVMAFYVNADAKRRQMNRVLWTLLVIFVPNAIGFIVYFILRQPIASPCPKCRSLVRQDFLVCPSCGHGLAPTCPTCHRAVEAGWMNCAYCGTKLG